MDKDTVVTLLKYKRWIDLATLQAIAQLTVRYMAKNVT
ncbi:DinB family protein [Klebsiella variicola]|nr:DinB family protein [Klebsiella variicola]